VIKSRTSRRARVLAIIASAAALFAATAATTTAGAAAAPAAATSEVAPPGPVEDLTLTPTSGGGNRGLAFAASWTPPEDPGDGIRIHYVIEAHDALGTTLYSTATGNTSVDRIVGDYCRAPFTISVHAVTQEPQSGAPIAGPAVEEQAGKLNLCEINMSIVAEQKNTMAVGVTMHREPPVDPSVVGACDLAFNGVVKWSGTCGHHEDRSEWIRDLAPGDYEVVLTTVSPRKDTYTATTHVTVSG
jgi:hypothetical protein